MSKPIKNSISYVIFNKDKSKFLAVQRPDEDEDFPGSWGLPAGSLKEGESFEDATIRSGRDKLGVRLKVVKLIVEGSQERTEYAFFMKVFEAEIVSGEPSVPQNGGGITQYQDIKWAVGDELKNTARKGSLCCQLYLEKQEIDW